MTHACNLVLCPLWGETSTSCCGPPFQTNLAGVCKLSNIKLARGASVTLRHGEILQHAGLPDLGKNVDPTMPYVL